MALRSSKINYVLGIDIGGTKIDAQLFEVKGGTISEVPAWNQKTDTQKGVTAHVSQIANIIEAAAQQVIALGGTLCGVGVGSPGRFDAEGKIKPGTNPNMGADGNINEFNGVDLNSAYAAALKLKQNAALDNLPLVVGNDGNAMLAGMIEAIQKGNGQTLIDQNGGEVTKFSLRDKHVALFGIGTGVGHAIAKIGINGGLSFVTDGHASKLRVKIDDEDWNMIEKAKANAGDAAVVSFDDHTVRAEDLFRGPIVNAMAGVSDGHVINLDKPDHWAAIHFAGKYMARTIQLIKSGQSEDVEPANGWTAADKQEAAKTSVYLIGGGMGSSPLGTAIIQYAQEELGVDNDAIKIVQVAGKNLAARAAATMVPESIYRGSIALTA